MNAAIDSRDFDLLPASLEDEAKSDEELWAELDAQEGSSAPETDDDAEWPVRGDEAPDAASEAASDVATQQDDADVDPAALERISAEREQYRQATSRHQSGAEPPVLADETWHRFAEEYPEVADPMGQVVERLHSEVARQRETLSAIESERREAELNEQAEMLSRSHPAWQQSISGPAFAAWLSNQPRHVREAAYRNADEIVDATEAADIVERFKKSRASRRSRPGRSSASSSVSEDADEAALWRQFDRQERTR